MKRVCTTCEQIWPETNLWCKTRTCNAGSLSVVLDYGEYLGDIQIMRMERVLRTATLYEAQRNKQRIMLKVAHDGCQEELKREATTLATLAKLQQHPMLPVLLPAFQMATLDERPYGKTVFQNQTKYYEVFEYIEGDSLRDVLLRNPQPWYQHAAWIITSLADALAFLHTKAQRLHLNLSPESVRVRMDKENIPRPVLLDLGIITEADKVYSTWITKYAHPSYISPELLEGHQPTVTADVYGLGLLLYEMLAGAPAYKFRMRAEDDIRREVRRTPVAPLQRTDLSSDIIAIVSQAVEKDPSKRYPDVRTFAKQLRTKFGEVPAENKRTVAGMILNRRLLLIIVAVIFAAVMLVVLQALIGAANTPPLP